MPFSNPSHLPAIVHMALTSKPATVLDIGIGAGLYGLLLRQQLDVAEQRLAKAEWKTRIEGIEIFEGYHNPVWDYAYDRIHSGDAREIVPRLGAFEFGLCLDVLEHFDRQEAVRLAHVLLEKCRTLIVSTPNGFIPQGAWCGNEAETHRCVLTRKDIPCCIAEIPAGLTTCYICTRDTSRVENLMTAAAFAPRCENPAPFPLLGKLLRRGRIRQATRNLEKQTSP